MLLILILLQYEYCGTLNIDMAHEQGTQPAINVDSTAASWALMERAYIQQ